MTGAAYRQIESAKPLSTTPKLAVVPDSPDPRSARNNRARAGSVALAAVPDITETDNTEPDSTEPDSGVRETAALTEIAAVAETAVPAAAVADNPVPVIGAVTDNGDDAGTGRPGVAGLRAVPHPAPVATKLCVEGHPNNAYGRSCRICGRRFRGASEILAMTPISVGRLLMEDGSAVHVVEALVIGRHPVGDHRMDTLTVTGRQVSRRHLLLEVRGWDLYVTDCDSTNGTFLTRRGERGRRRVSPDGAMAVRIGDSIHFGSRQALVVTGAG